MRPDFSGVTRHPEFEGRGDQKMLRVALKNQRSTHCLLTKPLAALVLAQDGLICVPGPSLAPGIPTNFQTHIYQRGGKSEELEERPAAAPTTQPNNHPSRLSAIPNVFGIH